MLEEPGSNPEDADDADPDDEGLDEEGGDVVVNVGGATPSPAGAGTPANAIQVPPVPFVHGNTHGHTSTYPHPLSHSQTQDALDLFPPAHHVQPQMQQIHFGAAAAPLNHLSQQLQDVDMEDEDGEWIDDDDMIAILPEASTPEGVIVSGGGVATGSQGFSSTSGGNTTMFPYAMTYPAGSGSRGAQFLHFDHLQQQRHHHHHHPGDDQDNSFGFLSQNAHNENANASAGHSPLPARQPTESQYGSPSSS
jgi:hypothetical protein